MSVQRILRAILMPIVAIFAIVYFLIDALFLSMLRPVGRLLGRLDPVILLTGWVRSLRPYPTLILFLVPLIVLEPAKPVGFYLMASRHVRMGVFVIAIAEVLKIVIVERLFHMSRDKLLSIGWFARIYRFVMRYLDWLRRLPAWQATRRMFVRIRSVFRRFFQMIIRNARRAIG
jgi:hypothetical protein